MGKISINIGHYALTSGRKGGISKKIWSCYAKSTSKRSMGIILLSSAMLNLDRSASFGLTPMQGL